jgi:hypothetical protein
VIGRLVGAIFGVADIKFFVVVAVKNFREPSISKFDNQAWENVDP